MVPDDWLNAAAVLRAGGCTEDQTAFAETGGAANIDSRYR